MSGKIRWWAGVLLLCLVHGGILIYNLTRVAPTQGYDWPGHLSYLQYVADHWRTPPSDVTPQFFNPPLYYFTVAAVHRITGLELGRAGLVTNLTLAAVTLLLLIGLARRLWGKSMLPALWFMGFYIFNPTVYRAFGMIRPEPMLIPLFVGAGWITASGSAWARRRKQLAIGTGLLAGFAFGVRQWGVFLEVAFLLWLLSLYLSTEGRPVRWRPLWACLGLQGVAFLIPAALFLILRGGGMLAFNTGAQKLGAEFLVRLDLRDLFTRPIRPNMDYRFWPVLYADFWGDYWRYWREALGHDAVASSPTTVAQLARSVAAALPATWLTVGGWLLGRRRVIGETPVPGRAELHRFARILTLVSLTGFLLFAGRYAEPGKGDTVKSVYVVYLVPLLGWLASVAVYRLLQAFAGRMGSVLPLLLLFPLILLLVFVSPNCFYLPPARMLERTWEMPPFTHPLNVTFGESITLLGYDLDADLPSRNLTLRLVWRADAYVGESYKVFVHLFAAGDRLIAQSDAVPAGWRRPTQGWSPGEFIVDTHTLEFSPSELCVIEQLAIGLYSEADGHRLTVAGGGDQVVIDLSGYRENLLMDGEAPGVRSRTPGHEGEGGQGEGGGVNE